MHEYSLIRALLSQVREAAKPHADAALDEIVIAIGPLAGVEPLLVASAFEVLTQDTSLGSTRLVIEHPPLRSACDSCGIEFESADVTFECPECRSARTRVIDGDGVILRRLILRDLQLDEAVP